MVGGGDLDVIEVVASHVHSLLILLQVEEVVKTALVVVLRGEGETPSKSPRLFHQKASYAKSKQATEPQT